MRVIVRSKAEISNFCSKSFWVPLGYHVVPKSVEIVVHENEGLFLHTKSWIYGWYPNGTQNQYYEKIRLPEFFSKDLDSKSIFSLPEDVDANNRLT